MKEKITRKNHYVPQLYLSGWETNKKIYTYDLLVPNANCPVWNRTSIENTGCVEDLYTQWKDGAETDRIENWFGQYESKAAESLRKARRGEHLTSSQWHSLIDFVAVQYMRTPNGFSLIKRIMTVASEKAAKESMDAFCNGTLEPETSTNGTVHEETPVKVEIDYKKGIISFEGVVGKADWYWAMKTFMSNGAFEIWHKQEWGIVNCHKDILWPTSDNPVICINYQDNTHYSFNAGIGIKGTQIIMPISPNKALYTMIKSKRSPRITANRQDSEFIKKLIAENATRYIFGYAKDDSILRYRKRKEDLNLYQEVKVANKCWHESYMEKEVPLLQ